MTLSISPEQMAEYKRGARERLAREEQETRQRREAAWGVAREAARVLREEFGARRIVAFGSLVQPTRFRQSSDIDLAVEGIAPEEFWHAWARLDYIEGDFEIDLINCEFALPHLRQAISQDGVEL